VEIIAHRGASRDAPENTLASLCLGFEEGADVGELDVRLTRDDQIVLMHDSTTGRTAMIDLAIRETNLAVLKRLDVGRRRGVAWARERIPTLDEALSILPPGKRLFVEIKCGPEILLPLERLLRTRPSLSRIAIIGFDWETMREAKVLFPHLEVYWLSAFKRERANKNRKPSTDRLIERALAADLDGLNLLHAGRIDAAFVRKAHRAGLKVYVWTVDNPRRARKLATVGVDGLATNRPGWMRRRLAAKTDSRRGGSISVAAEAEATP
jgi:glycerophosphoryl diester phosphodiesterase